jgi:transcriptional regulator with XRE-family HTH domain
MMGKSARERPTRLAEKLLQIRVELGLSQNEMLAALGLKGKILRSAISGFETGAREPSLLVVLSYARLAGVSTDVLIDDELDLPEHLPTKRGKRG